MTKAVELRTLADHELADRLEESRRELFNLRFQLATSQSTNTARLKTLKKEIARVLAIQTERAYDVLISEVDK
ncbi:MAG: 50S ribosomal protein L29 [Acidimicrobiales bacterium]